MNKKDFEMEKYYIKNLENNDLFQWAVCFDENIACLCPSKDWAEFVCSSLNVCEMS